MNDTTILTEAKMIINKNIEIFQNSIVRLMETDNIFREGYSGFPLLTHKYQDFYNLKRRESVLENDIREELINPIICQLLELHKFRVINPENSQVVGGETNRSFERHTLFEFVVHNEEVFIGYRYTDWDKTVKDTKRILRANKISKIVIIDWGNTDEVPMLQTKQFLYKKYADWISYMTIHDFFEEYFIEAEYVYFIESVQKAIDDAFLTLDLSTIPKLTRRYLHVMKKKVENDLAAIKYETEKYLCCSANNKVFEIPESTDLHNLFLNYSSQRIFQAILGYADFSRSYITAEYLYEIMNDGYNIDYTSVAIGYFKTIEQILRKLTLIALDYHQNDQDDLGLWIKYKGGKEQTDNSNYKPETKRTRKGLTLVRFKVENLEYFDMTMGSLSHFWRAYNNGWNISSIKSIQRICNMLDDYTSEYRNLYLHSQNINDFEIITRIRHNTQLLCFYLLAGCKKTGDYENDAKELCYANCEYDKLYEAIKSVHAYKFYFKFEGNAEILAIRNVNQPWPKYDNQGYLVDSPIKFYITRSFEEFDYEHCEKYSELIIDHCHMPEKAWYSTLKNSKIEILW